MTTQTYSEAMQALEQIVRELEAGKLNLDQIATKIAQAQKLITQCRSQLLSVEKDIQDVLAQNDNL